MIGWFCVNEYLRCAKDWQIPPAELLRFRASYFSERSGKDILMTLYPKITAAKMEAVKSSCQKAPFGEKRTAALKHYFAAETAYAADDNAKMNMELDAAKRVLA
jgi:hypothetical protein